MVLSQEEPTAEKLAVHEVGGHQPGVLWSFSSEPNCSHPPATGLRSPKVFIKCKRASSSFSQNPPRLEYFAPLLGYQRRRTRVTLSLTGLCWARGSIAWHRDTLTSPSLPDSPVILKSKRKADWQTREERVDSYFAVSSVIFFGKPSLLLEMCARRLDRQS